MMSESSAWHSLSPILYLELLVPYVVHDLITNEKNSIFGRNDVSLIPLWSITSNIKYSTFIVWPSYAKSTINVLYV